MELREIRKQYLPKQTDYPDIMSDLNLVVSHMLKIDIADISPFTKISDLQYKYIKRTLSKHMRGVPIQKLIGYSIFQDCYIAYSKHTLTPRLETELLVEKVLEDINDKKDVSVLDLCSGSGCIGIAIAKKSNAKVTCADISRFAIRDIKQNARINNVAVEIVRSNMFDNINDKYDVIVCNPPYIPIAEYKQLDSLVKGNDPKLALVADNNGLEFYEIIANLSSKYLRNGGKLFLEIGYNQGKNVKNLLLNHFNKIEVLRDYSQNDRIVIAQSI